METAGPQELNAQPNVDLSGVRPRGRRRKIGNERKDLDRLREAGVPVVSGEIVGLRGDDPTGSLGAAVLRVLEEQKGGDGVVLRPLASNREVAAKLARPDAATTWIERTDSDSETTAKIESLIEGLNSADLRATLGGSLDSLSVFVFAADAELRGRAASVEPVRGDPEHVWVWMKAAAPWHVDRRTARVTQHGEGILNAGEASLVADLADRAQLALFHPVEIDWTRADGRFAITAVRPLHFTPAFAPSPFRIVTLVAADEGTVAPLAIDALDRAMSRDDEPSDEPRVRRIYARPFRRQDDSDRYRRTAADTISVARMSLRAAQVAKDVAAPLAAVRRFERSLEDRLRALDAERIEELDDQAVLTALWERQRLAVEAFILLDRHRVATIAVLTALEMSGCAIPRETFPAIARPRHTRARQRIHEQLRELAADLEAAGLNVMDLQADTYELPADLRRKWEDLKQNVVDVRPLGIDVCARAIGSTDATFIQALRDVQKIDEDTFRRERRIEVKKILSTARSRPLGRPREALASSLILLQSRVSRSKGVAVEGLSAALLRVRRAACEVGRRLVDACVLDHPEHALYMDLPELEQALAGEPGAYASRVRLRREDDDRWADYDAPRRIESRRPQT